MLAVTQRVKLKNLVSAAHLNGKIGTICEFDWVKQRYAVALEGAAPSAKPLLVKPENLECDNGPETRFARRAALAEKVARQHDLKVMSGEHMPAVMAAKSRAEIPDAVWDIVVEAQRECEVACRECDAGYPELMQQAMEANDAPCWSHSAVAFAFYQ